MNRLKKYFVFVLLGTTLLTACSKDEPKQKSQSEQKEKDEKRVVFKASINAEVQPFTLLEYGADENEARAAITSRGYAVPSLDITKAELQDGSIQAHWGVLGGSKDPNEESVLHANILPSVPATPPNVSSLFIKKHIGSKNDLTFYCPVSSRLAPYTTKWAYFAFGGKRSSDKRYLEFKGATSPNKKIVGIKNTEEQTARQLPLMTDVQAFDNLLASMSNPLAHAPKTKFKPRGCLIGLCFVNKFDEDITITDIIAAKDNALYFEGKFDMQKDKDGYTDFKTSTHSGNKQARFEGDNKSFTYPVYASNGATTKGYTLAKVNGSFNDAKDKLPLFHLWGMPKEEGCSDRLRFQVKLKKGGQEFTTLMFDVTLPGNNPFIEGRSYRLPILLNDNSLHKLAGSGHNPLDFVAEYDLNRGTEPLGFGGSSKTITIGSKTYRLSQYMPHPTAFRTSHDLPTVTDVTTPGQSENTIGYLTFDEAVFLFDHNKPAWLNDYVLPTVEQWNSIFKLGYVAFFSRFDKGITPKFLNIQEDHILSMIHDENITNEFEYSKDITVGSDVMKDVKSDYCIKLECPNYVTYALRFKDTKWESAWRYSFDKRKKAVIIECIGGLQDSGKTLATISYPEFFSSNSVTTTRVFPAYGLRTPVSSSDYHSSSPTILGTSDYGFYWALPREFSPVGIYFGKTMIQKYPLHYNHGFAIRPFKKTLD